MLFLLNRSFKLDRRVDCSLLISGFGRDYSKTEFKKDVKPFAEDAKTKRGQYLIMAVVAVGLVKGSFSQSQALSFFLIMPVCRIDFRPVLGTG